MQFATKFSTEKVRLTRSVLMLYLGLAVKHRLGSKSLNSGLKLLRAGNDDYVINEDALEYMQSHKLPGFQLKKLIPLSGKQFKTEKKWKRKLKSLKIKSKNHIRIATEGGLVGSIIHHGYNKDMAIISDDAGQFNVFLHGLCWVHTERTIQKLIGFTKKNVKLLENTRKDIWDLYRELKKYRINPDEAQKQDLEKQFDELFTRKTKWVALDQALKRIYQNRAFIGSGKA